MIVASATTLSIGTTTIKAQAQNAATPEQIKDYLTQAIQALESGDNAKAIQQLKLATDQIDGSTGVSTVSSNGESDDKGEGAEEGKEGREAREAGKEGGKADGAGSREGAHPRQPAGAI